MLLAQLLRLHPGTNRTRGERLEPLTEPGGIMAYRIVVDRTRCEGNAVCERIAPEIFQVGEEDEMTVLKEEIGDDLLELVGRAVQRCPRAALSIVET